VAQRAGNFEFLFGPLYEYLPHYERDWVAWVSSERLVYLKAFFNARKGKEKIVRVWVAAEGLEFVFFLLHSICMSDGVSSLYIYIHQ